MLKKLGLIFPPLRRLRDERNKYANLVEELTKEIALLRGNSPQPERGLQNQLLMLKQELSKLNAQVGKFETDVRFCFDDVRREFFSFSTSRNALQKAYQIKTDYPIAVKSDDHVYPRGTRNDNTRYPRFVHAAERAIGKNLRVMELGCAGGGLVLDFILEGHDAVGIEGSDYSDIWRRAEWANIPDRLFTADITKPFSIFVNNEQQKFDLITAWEVLEHIRDDDLDGLFANIRQYLTPTGVFCGSVATFEDGDPVSGAVYHVTVKPYEWWVKRITDAGFEIVEGLFTTADFPRGSGNPRAYDWDAIKDPHLGFHICFRIKHSASR